MIIKLLIVPNKINIKMDIVLELEDKIKHLESLAERYKNKYLTLLYKFRRYRIKQKYKEKRLRDLLEDLNVLLIELKNNLDKIDRLSEQMDKLEEEVNYLRKEIVRMNAKLYEIYEIFIRKWKKR